MNCTYCGKSTSSKFCSRSCAASYNNKAYPKRKKTKKCKICGNLIYATRTHCKNCWGGWEKKTHKVCPDCHRSLPLSKFHHTGGRNSRPFRRCKQCHHIWWNKRNKEFKQKCVDFLGGGCLRCGYNKCLAALEFHHRNPRHKEFEIGRQRTDVLTVQIIKELKKCDLLCSNCHRELHNEE